MKHILVLGTQVPFVKGGAELLNESLIAEINKLPDIQAELVQLPYKWYPEDQLIDDIMAWRMLDLSESNGKKIDLVIATKFPSYAARHPNKVLWLVHQHRYFYDLEFSQYDAFHSLAHSKQTRDTVRHLDTKIIKECKPKYTIAQNVSERLQNYNQIDSTPLYPPAPLGDKIKPGEYGNYIVYIGRVETIKRVNLLVEALPYCHNLVKIVIIGKGQDLEPIRQLIKDKRLENQCFITGYLAEEKLLDYLANCRALFYAPFDEDYGYATIEAFLAKKPVISCNDSGEVTNIVKQTGSGYISLAEPEAIAENIDKIYQASPAELEKQAQRGYQFAQQISWEKVLQKLVLDNI